MAYEKSPWRENKIDIKNVLGLQKLKNPKGSVYPNKGRRKKDG